MTSMHPYTLQGLPDCAGAEPARRLRGPRRGAGGHDGRRLDALRRHRLAQVRHLILHGRRARLGESAQES